MKKLTLSLCWPVTRLVLAGFVLLGMVATPLAVQAKSQHKSKQSNSAAVPNYADIVIEAKTGRILHETNGNRLRHPASLTKMMTLYMTFQALESGQLKLNQYLPVSANAAAQSPSKLGLRRDTRIRVEDAILGLVTESANDAAVVLGEWLGGSEEGFAKKMTAQAKALGMMQTRFKNPSGLPDPEQVTTARDMAMLGHALIYHFQNYYPYFSTRSFTYAGLTHANHNHLMSRYDGMDGIKTGYIRASGFNLVASAERDGVRLIGVVFGGRSARSRDNQMAQLLDNAWDVVGRETVPVASSAGGKERVQPVEPQGDAAAEVPAEEDKADVDLPARNKPVKAAAKKTEAKAKKSAAAKPSRKEKKQTAEQADTSADNDSDKWGVQIGAYTRAEVGRAALEEATRTWPYLLANATPMLDKVSAKRGAVYRARLMSLGQENAESVCAAMTDDGKDCQVISP